MHPSIIQMEIRETITVGAIKRKLYNLEWITSTKGTIT